MIHDAPLVADQGHAEEGNVTVTLPVVAAPVTVRLVGDSVALQFGAPTVLCEIMYGYTGMLIQLLRPPPVVLGSTVSVNVVGPAPVVGVIVTHLSGEVPELASQPHPAGIVMLTVLVPPAPVKF